MSNLYEVEVKAYHLRHPLTNKPAIAQFRGYWIGRNGRNVGLYLKFDDGEKKLTYRQIRTLQEGVTTT